MPICGCRYYEVGEPYICPNHYHKEEEGKAYWSRPGLTFGPKCDRAENV